MGTKNKIYEYTTKNGEVRYQARARLKGFQISGSFKRKSDAKTWLKDQERDIEEKIAKGTSPSRQFLEVTMSDAIELFRRDGLTRIADDWEYMLDTVQEYLGGMKLIGLRRSHIVEAINTYRISPDRKKGEKGLIQPKIRKASTCNKFLTMVRNVLKAARQEYGLTVDPAKDIPYMNEDDDARDRFLDDLERPRLLAAARRSQNPFLIYVILIALMTGYRLSVIKHLRWRNIDLEGLDPTIRLKKKQTNEKGKRGKGRTRNIPIVAKLREVFLEIKELHRVANIESEFLFPSPEDRRKPWDFERAFVNAVKSAKIEDFHFHDLRHTAGFYLGRQNVPALVIKEILGHRDLSSTQRYVQFAPKYMRDAMEQSFESVMIDSDEPEVDAA